MTEKMDLRKQLKHLYTPSAKNAQIVDVPAFNFIMLDGVIAAGTPPAESPAFQQALQLLYGAAFTLKFMSKLDATNPIDYTVMALEGLWSTASGQFDFQRKEDWLFTLMILQPEHITPEMFQQAKDKLAKKEASPLLEQLRLTRFHEGNSVQMMHIGPYAEEPVTLERMYGYASEQGYTLHGRHHEIYLGDPRRADPAKLKTILRHPVKKS